MAETEDIVQTKWKQSDDVAFENGEIVESFFCKALYSKLITIYPIK